MKKILFFISLVFSAILLINVLQIVIFDFNELTEFGYGYLTGKVVLLVLFLLVLDKTRPKKALPKP